MGDGRSIYLSSSIPPTPPEGSGCVLGCCLIPATAGYLIKELLKANADSSVDTLGLKGKQNFNVGISYTPSLTRRGPDLRGLSPAWGGIADFDLSFRIYLLNAIQVKGSYYTPAGWGIKLGMGYMWGKMEDCDDVYAKPKIDKRNAASISYRNIDWEISSLITTLSISKTFKKYWFLDLTGEYYFSKGVDHEERLEWVPGEPETKSYIIATNCGRGPGFSLNTGLEKPINSNVSWNLSLGMRIGNTREYKYKVPEGVIWNGPVSINFTGVYIILGINYDLFGKGGG